MQIATLGGTILTLLAPSRCMKCATEDSWLCKKCIASLSPITQHCIVCNKENTRGTTCITCTSETPLTGVVSAGLYADPGLRRGIGWLKFKGVRGVASPLAALTIPKLFTIASLDHLSQEAALVPIPLHARRQRQRGFNQAEDIAHELSRYTSIPTAPILMRHKATWAQAKLPREMRAQNSRNAFRVVPDAVLTKSSYILIDDVVTSGTTLSSAARALKPYIPSTSQLWAVTVARG